MNAPAKERTLAVIKPGAFKMRQTGVIISEIQSKFAIKAMLMVTFTEAQAKAFYAEHATKSFFTGLVEHATMGPCVVLVLEGPGVIQKWRDAMGPTEPMLGTPGVHLRAKYGYGMPGNALHGSDSAEAFEREYDIVFPQPKTVEKTPELTAVQALVKALETTPPEAMATQLVQEAKESTVVPPAPGASETAGG